jgi:hypothetical protein
MELGIVEHEEYVPIAQGWGTAGAAWACTILHKEEKNDDDDDDDDDNDDDDDMF